MSQPRIIPVPPPWTLDDFLAWEEQQPERYEFVDGVVRMMVGGTAAHNTIINNVAAALRSRLRGSGCRYFTEGMKVVSPTDQSTYPDVVVTCRPVGNSYGKLTEPALIVEVLSRSTADHDRGAKWEMYRTIPTLANYVLISQYRRSVDLYRRTAAGWEIVQIEGSGTIDMPALGCTIDLDEIYEDVVC